MATMALPVQMLSADVTVDAAAAQKKCLEVVESIQQSDLVQRALMWWKVQAVDSKLGTLVLRQQDLITHLDTLDTSAFTLETFDTLARRLDQIVALTYGVIDLANGIHEYADRWQSKLILIGDHAAHLASFAESYHVASDEICTAALADMAKRMMSDIRVNA